MSKTPHGYLRDAQNLFDIADALIYYDLITEDEWGYVTHCYTGGRRLSIIRRRWDRYCNNEWLRHSNYKNYCVTATAFAKCWWWPL